MRSVPIILAEARSLGLPTVLSTALLMESPIPSQNIPPIVHASDLDVFNSTRKSGPNRESHFELYVLANITKEFP